MRKNFRRYCPVTQKNTLFSGKPKEWLFFSSLPPAIRSELDVEGTKKELSWIHNKQTTGSQAPVVLQSASVLKVVWRCSSCSKRWVARPCDRTRSQNPVSCPHCSRSVEKKSNFLVDCFPTLAAQWNLTKNSVNELSPELSRVSANSSSKVWWSCPHCEKSWKESVSERVNRYQSNVAKYGKSYIPLCTTCEKLGISERINGSTAFSPKRSLLDDDGLLREARLAPHQDAASISLTSDIVLNWECSVCLFSFTASVSNRYLRHERCPQCSGRILTPLNALLIQRPDVVAEINADVPAQKLQKMTVYDDGMVRFTCRTCLSPYTMSLKTRCLIPKNGVACPKCFSNASKSAERRPSRRNFFSPQRQKEMASALRMSGKVKDTSLRN